MKKILGLFIIAAFVGLSVLAFTPTPSYALPNFAKKHEASCTLCHTVWPALNRFGEQYFMNGFQMPDSEDGGDVGKINPDEHVSLDSGNANPPLSARIVIETTLTRDAAVEGASTDSRTSLIEATKAEVPFFLGGTLGKNLSYFVDNAATDGLPEQMWVGIHNIGGPGTLNIKYGLLSVQEFDAWSRHRHDLGGSFVNGLTMPDGATETGAVDTKEAVGLQFYGRPGFGPLTYQVTVDNHDRDKTNSLNYGLMLRGDFEPVAVSYHYAANTAKKSAWSNGKDITSTTHLIAARAILTGIEVSAAYVLNNQEDKSTTMKFDNSALVLEGIYFTELFDVQLRYSSGTVDKLEVAGVSSSSKSDYDRSRISLKTDYHATTNSKIYFKYETDSYKGDSLKATGVYGVMNGAVAMYNDGYASIGVDWAF